jgi:hypothetical protein
VGCIYTRRGFLYVYVKVKGKGYPLKYICRHRGKVYPGNRRRWLCIKVGHIYQNRLFTLYIATVKKLKFALLPRRGVYNWIHFFRCGNTRIKKVLAIVNRLQKQLLPSLEFSVQFCVRSHSDWRLVSGCWVDNRSSIPSDGGFSIYHSVQIDSGAHLASYPVGIVAFFFPSLFSRQYLSFPIGLFPSLFQPKILHKFLVSPKHVTCYAQKFILHLLILILFLKGACYETSH